MIKPRAYKWYVKIKCKLPFLSITLCEPEGPFSHCVVDWGYFLDVQVSIILMRTDDIMCVSDYSVTTLFLLVPCFNLGVEPVGGAEEGVSWCGIPVQVWYRLNNDYHINQSIYLDWQVGFLVLFLLIFSLRIFWILWLGIILYLVSDVPFVLDSKASTTAVMLTNAFQFHYIISTELRKNSHCKLELIFA